MDLGHSFCFFCCICSTNVVPERIVERSRWLWQDSNLEPCLAYLLVSYVPTYPLDIIEHDFKLNSSKVCLLLDPSCVILISYKTMVIFNNTSTDILLKLATILKELRITYLQSKNKQTFIQPLYNNLCNTLFKVFYDLSSTIFLP